MPAALPFGSDHAVAAGPALATAVVAVVVAAVVVADCVADDVADEAVELAVLLDDLWLLPPHAAIATDATTAAITVTARHCPIPLIVSLSLGGRVKLSRA